MATEVIARRGKLYVAASNGRLYHASTVATGVAPGTAIGTTAAFSLYNPAASGVNLIVKKVSMGYISGTLGAGTVWHLVNSTASAAATTGTAITAIPGKLNSGTASGKPLTTATLPAAPEIVRPFASLQASLATTAVAPWQVQEDLEDGIVIPEGCTYSLHATAAAGTSPLVAFGVTWEELTIGVD